METAGQLTIGKKSALIFGAMFILVVAVALHVEYLYYMAFALALPPAVSYLIGRRTLRGLMATRRMPAVAKAGESLRIGVALANRAGTRKQFMVLRDDLPPGLLAEGPAERFVPDLAPGETVELDYPVLARRRGVYNLGWVDLHTTDPLGMFSYRGELEAVGSLVVHPRPVPLPRVRTPSAGHTVSSRVRSRKLDGGTDFRGIREYTPGDDLRRVHWKTTARRGKLTIVEYESGEANSLGVALDLSPRHHAGQEEESTLEYGVTLAASIASQALRRGAELSLVAEGAQSYSLRSLAAPTEETRVMDALARVRANAPADFAGTLIRLEEWLPHGAGVVIVSPAVGPEVVAAVQRLVALGHGVLWVSLVASSFAAENDPAAPPESAYEELAAGLAAARCEVRQVRRGDSLASRMGVRLHAA